MRAQSTRMTVYGDLNVVVLCSHEKRVDQGQLTLAIRSTGHAQ